ncbi:MAG TPA: hypothetical protein VF625_01155 [Longimicrobium sp.]
MELLDWSQQFSVPESSDGAPKKVRFTSASLPVPEDFRTGSVVAGPGYRRPGGEAISIDSASVTAGRAGYRALGLAMLGYALSEQRAPLRIHLAPSVGRIQQIVFWPASASRLEASLGFRLGVGEIHYRPRLPEGNPNYTTVDQDDPSYPREHLPYCGLGPPDSRTGGVVRADEPVCLHVGGTVASLVWLGKLLLNLSLADNNCRLAYLYNYNPAESLAPGSAELRLMVGEVVEGEVIDGG